MPQAPMLPPEMMVNSGAAAPVSPANFLMAAADLHKQGALPDAAQGRSMPSGVATTLASGKRKGRGKLQVLK